MRLWFVRCFFGGALMRVLASGPPPCTFDACDRCLSDAKETRSNLTFVIGAEEITYSLPFRIGRAAEYWDSQAVVAQIVGVLVQEKLGINVEYVNCAQEVACTYSAANCLGWMDQMCSMAYTTSAVEEAVANNTKLFNDLAADVMFFTETNAKYTVKDAFEGTELNFETRQFEVVGPTGYSVRDGIFTYSDVLSTAKSMGFVSAAWFPSLVLTDFRVLFNTPQQLIDGGVAAEEKKAQGCSSDTPFTEYSMQFHRDLGWTCVDGWWLNPVCAAFGVAWTTVCVVVMEDGWSYFRGWMYKALAESEVPVAKVVVGFDPWWDLVYYKTFNVTFTWWRPDASILAANPERLQLGEFDDHVPNSALKVAWGAAAETDPRLRYLLDVLLVQNSVMNNLMERVAAMYESGYSSGATANNFYQKVACDWVRDNEATWSKWLPSARSCSRGEYFSATESACSLCPTGTRGMKRNDGSTECLACRPGEFAGLPGMTECSPCSPGSCQKSEAASACRPCPVGRSQSTEGQSQCLDCMAGRASTDEGASMCSSCPAGTAAVAGSSSCEICAIGTFAVARRASPLCEPCPFGQTTEQAGSDELSLCCCAEGSYWPKQGGVCLPCPEGMTCAIGSDIRHFQATPSQGTKGPHPQLLPGFYSSAAAPLEVYRCSSERACPGGEPGSCSGGRDEDGGFLCRTCAVGEYLAEDGTCRLCSGINYFLLIVVGLVLLIGSMIVLRLSAKKITSQTPHVATFFVVFGQLVAFVQVGATFRTFGVLWGSPFERLLKLFSLFTWNLDILKTDCMNLGTDVQSYAFQLFAPMCLVAFMSVAFGVASVARPGFFTLNGYCNSIGQLAVLLYITLTIISMIPFHCYDHPSGRQSIIEYPSVLCDFGAEYSTMLAMGVIGVLMYPVATFAIALYATLKYPYVISSVNLGFVWRFRFLFFRWVPQRYWFGVFQILRNFSLSVFPMSISQSSSDVTVLLMQLTLLVNLLVTIYAWPWKTFDMNVLDIGLNFVLLVCMNVGGMTVFGNTLSDSMSTFLLAMASVGLAMAVLLALYRFVMITMKRIMYAVFLSHHKGSGACVARLLKHTLQTEMRKPVFYDCDDLTSFSAIFDSVKQSDCLLVILSGETLCRPWCIGEIVVAFQCNISMFPLSIVHTLGATIIETHVLANATEQAKSMEQMSVLLPYGIFSQDIAPAIAALLSKVAVKLDLSTSSSFMDSRQDIAEKVRSGKINQGILAKPNVLVDKIMSLGTSRRARKSCSARTESCSARTVLVCCDANSVDCKASAHLLRIMVQEKLQEDTAVDLDILDNKFAEAVSSTSIRAVVFCVMPASTSSPNQLARLVVLHVARPHCAVVTVIIGNSFIFPDSTYYDEMEGETATFSPKLRDVLPQDLTPQDVANALRYLFQGIAVFVNVPQASRSVLDTSVVNLTKRLRDVWSKPVGEQLENGRVVAFCKSPSSSSIFST